MRRQRELTELKENFQNEMLTATQQHVDREIELQDFCQREKDAHSKTVEVNNILRGTASSAYLHEFISSLINSQRRPFLK